MHAEPTGAARPGLRLGAWVLQQPLGQGGRGQVWLAQRGDGLYQGLAAIKLMHGDAASPAIAQHLARERTALGQLNHTGITALLDAGMQAPHAYLVLEWVDGLPLTAHVRQHCPTVAGRVALLLRLAEAVEHAHARLVVHRDLKPANVMVTAAGAPKLLDFGLSTAPGLHEAAPQALTPGYAAPERILGEDGGTAADVFSLGVMLYELLTGSLPLGRRTDSRVALEHATLHQPPHAMAALLRDPPDDAGPGRPQDAAAALGDLEAITTQALCKEAAGRYVGVHALMADLQRWQARRPVAARRGTGWRHATGLWLRRHALPAGVGGAVLLALSAGLAVSRWQWHEAEAAHRRSDTVTRFLTELLQGHGAGDAREGAAEPPSMLALLDASRARLAGQFEDDPRTRQQLLEVLSRTYTALNRFDEALPLGEQWLALARQQHGATDAPVLRAQLNLGQVNQIMGNHDAAIALLEPLAGPLARHFGPDSEEVRQQQFILAADYMHSRRLAESEAALERVRVLTERLHPGDDYERADYLLNLGVLRRLQGRPAESLAVVRQTRPLWASRDPRLTLPVLVLRRHEVFMMTQNVEFDGLDDRIGPLVADVRRALGPGNDFALTVLANWATAKQLQGLHAQELAVREQLLDSARADGVAPDGLLVFRAERLLAQARLGRPDEAALQALMAEAAALRGGGRRSRSLLLLADAALAAGNTRLATDAVARLREQPLSAALAARGSRLDRTEGRLARANGEFARSVALLSGVQDIGLIEAWAGRLDVALSAALQGSPEAGPLLEAARRARPAALPPGHPLDRVSQWLTARQAAGLDDDPAVRQAWTALAPARGPGAPPPTPGNLGGLLP